MALGELKDQCCSCGLKPFK